MSDKEILDNIEQVFKITLGIDYFNIDLSMNEIMEWDSIKQISFIYELEKKFNVQIEYNDVIEMYSIRNIFNIIKSYLDK